MDEGLRSTGALPEERRDDQINISKMRVIAKSIAYGEGPRRGHAATMTTRRRARECIDTSGQTECREDAEVSRHRFISYRDRTVLL